MSEWVKAVGLFALAAVASAQSSDTRSPREALRAAFGGPALAEVGRFDYRLTVESADHGVQRDAYYSLAPAAGARAEPGRRLRLRAARGRAASGYVMLPRAKSRVMLRSTSGALLRSKPTAAV